MTADMEPTPGVDIDLDRRLSQPLHTVEDEFIFDERNAALPLRQSRPDISQKSSFHKRTAK